MGACSQWDARLRLVCVGDLHLALLLKQVCAAHPTVGKYQAK